CQAGSDVPPLGELEGGIVLASATPLGSLVLYSAAWPEIDQAVEAHAEIALELIKAIESPTYEGPFIIAGVSNLLGPQGLQVLQADLQRLAGDGKTVPLVCLLAAQTGTTISTLITSTILPKTTVH